MRRVELKMCWFSSKLIGLSWWRLGWMGLELGWVGLGQAVRYR
jgi:hypothetical protein